VTDAIGSTAVAHTTLEHRDGLAVLEINRPPANAMSLELLDEIVAALAEVDRDPPAALVLSGREGFFSAGVDLKEVPNYGPEEQRRSVTAINDMALSAYALPCPVVGAITGHAIAGGLVLALCTDIRIAAAAGKYGLTEVKVGVPYPKAAIGVVRAELAPHAARALTLGNQLVDGVEGVRLGVFDEAIDAQAVLPRALEVAQSLAGFPAEGYARTKHELRAAVIERLRREAAEDPLLASWVP
jgi:enoyl-CoA hydratase